MSEYDVFLCYAWESKDRAADPLRAALQAEGLVVFQDEPSMEDFDHLGSEIDRALHGSRVLLALVSPKFSESEYCRQELHYALTRSYALDRSRARVLAVLHDVGFADVRPGRLTNWRLQAPGQPLEATARSIAAHVRRLVDADGRRLGEAPDPPPPDWYPRPVVRHADFHGRELDMWAVHDALFPDDTIAVGGQVVAVTGPSGAGKTMLAEQYSRLFAADFPGGVFVLRGFGSHGETRGASPRMLALLDRHMVEITDSVSDGTDPREHLRRRGPYLWIVDDLPSGIDRATFDQLLAPTGNGRTLVTARHDLAAWVPTEAHVRIGTLGRWAAMALLLSRWPEAGSAEGRLRRLRTEPAAYAAAGHLVDLVGSHPLALALAAARLTAPGFDQFAVLLDRVSDHDRDVVNIAAGLDLRLPTDHAASIATTIWYAVESVRDSDLLRLASLAAPAPLPAALFSSVLAEADGVATAEAEVAVADELAELERRMLTLPTAADRRGAVAWEVHSLVGRVLRMMDRDSARRHRLRAAAVKVSTEILEAGWVETAPDALAGYLPHVEQLASDMQDVDEWHLLNEAGKVHAELGSTRELLALYERLHESCRQHLGDEHMTTLVMLVGLGVAHGLHGDHAAAREVKQRAVDLLTERLGPDRPETLVALNNLAVTYDEIGEHERARDLYQGVHSARLRLLGPLEADTLEALMNLSIAVGRCGDHETALQLKREALDLATGALGEEHPRTLDARHNLAVSLMRNDGPAAHRLFVQLIEDRRRSTGDRVDTAGALEGAGATSDDPDTSVAMMDEAYRLRLAVQGPAHPQTRRTLRNLLVAERRRPAPDLADQADQAEHAEQDPAGAELEPTLDEPEPVVPAEVDLGTVLLDDEDMDERVELFRLAADVYDRVLVASGHDAPATMVAVARLAHAHALLGQMERQVDDAWALIDDAAEGLDEQLGPAHPDAQLAELLRRWVADLAALAAPG